MCTLQIYTKHNHNSLLRTSPVQWTVGGKVISAGIKKSGGQKGKRGGKKRPAGRNPYGGKMLVTRSSSSESHAEENRDLQVRYGMQCSTCIHLHVCGGMMGSKTTGVHVL